MGKITEKYNFLKNQDLNNITPQDDINILYELKGVVNIEWVNRVFKM